MIRKILQDWKCSDKFTKKWIDCYQDNSYQALACRGGNENRQPNQKAISMSSKREQGHCHRNWLLTIGFLSVLRNLTK